MDRDDHCTMEMILELTLEEFKEAHEEFLKTLDPEDTKRFLIVLERFLQYQKIARGMCGNDLVVVCKHVFAGTADDITMSPEGDYICGECCEKLFDLPLDDLVTMCKHCVGELV